MKPVVIAGAGLAGLALGNALARAGVPTTIHESGNLPRHRVCGEFICGRGAGALKELDLSSTLEGALPHLQVHWIRQEATVLKARLPAPAYGISRYLLDARLAEAFKESGGTLKQQSRFDLTSAQAGTVVCSGRQPIPSSEWIGLKLHCTNLETNADLELHLGDQGYVGLSGIENARVNVCGLFKQRIGLKVPRQDCFLAYLKAAGLETLATRIRAGGIDPMTHSGVAGIQFASKPQRSSGTIRLGDAYSVIPPFTGNGMSIALEAAAIAFPYILGYAREEITWNSAAEALSRNCEQRFARRLRAARQLHPWLSRPAGQTVLSTLARLHLLPFRFLYNLTH